MSTYFPSLNPDRIYESDGAKYRVYFTKYPKWAEEPNYVVDYVLEGKQVRQRLSCKDGWLIFSTQESAYAMFRRMIDCPSLSNCSYEELHSDTWKEVIEATEEPGEPPVDKTVDHTGGIELFTKVVSRIIIILLFLYFASYLNILVY